MAYYRYRPVRYRYRRYSRDRVPPAAKVAVLVLGATLAAGAGHAAVHKAPKPAPLHASAAATKAIAYARAQLGAPYTWGGTGPYATGYDCSGLTSEAYAAGGVGIPRTSEEQYAALRRVSAQDLAPGDLVFSYWAVDNQASPNHVQLYVGGGWVIGADSTNVEKVPLSTDAGHIVGYARPAGVS
jgi:cell wall-associated NlpC family hydrolase